MTMKTLSFKMQTGKMKSDKESLFIVYSKLWRRNNINFRLLFLSTQYHSSILHFSEQKSSTVLDKVVPMHFHCQSQMDVWPLLFTRYKV